MYALIFVSGLGSLLGCLALVFSLRLHGRFSLDPMAGVQKVHVTPTPRVGGVAVFIALVLADLTLANTASGSFLTMLLLAALPTFFLGLYEDLFKKGGVTVRLLGTFISASLGLLLLQIGLSRVDVLGIDSVIQHWPLFGSVFTVFAVAGVTNAFNIIDGANGLSSGAGVISSLALAGIAYSVGDAVLLPVCLALAAATLGFWLVNFPWGKLFLGDSGAYLVGFLIAWLAVLLVERNPDVSAWAPLLACAYPVIESVFTIIRRLQKRGFFGDPDRLHLHSLLLHRVMAKNLRQAHPAIQNACSSVPLLLVHGLLGALAVLFYSETALLGLAFFAACVAYWVWYLRIIRFGSEYQLR